jgi:hypothetical protein
MNNPRRQLLIILVTTLAYYSIVRFYTSESANLQGLRKKPPQNTDPSCYKARYNTKPLRHDYAQGPFINVGMPKMGSTSLHKVSAKMPYSKID